MLLRGTLFLIILLLAGPAVADVLDDLVVVTHPGVSVDSISSRELQRIFLGKSTRWPGGERVRPVLLDGAPVRATFVTELLGRTEENFTVYWKRMVFTGKGRPPRSFATAAELAFYVRATEGAIGFLPADAELVGLKVVPIE